MQHLRLVNRVAGQRLQLGDRRVLQRIVKTAGVDPCTPLSASTRIASAHSTNSAVTRMMCARRFSATCAHARKLDSRAL